ncbi:MAG: hypothetical protein LBL93_01075 [Ruminococcus sp.]|jgi:hypothetical protein|nr:hypothetical protein [Ruminococcus sp.]
MDLNKNPAKSVINLLGLPFVVNSYNMKLIRPYKVNYTIEGLGYVTHSNFHPYTLKLVGYFEKESGFSPNIIRDFIAYEYVFSFEIGGVTYSTTKLTSFSYSEDIENGNVTTCELNFISEDAEKGE